MSNLRSYAYPGAGEFARDTMHYSQAIRVGDNIFISGQGGWDRSTIEIRPELTDEVDQAFDNVDHALKHAGGKGWQQVYRVITYSTDTRATHDRIIDNFRRWMPHHQPTWTEIGVRELGLDTMHIEIEVQAYDVEGAKEAEKGKGEGGVNGVVG
ncbi:YjgF-like protein [Hypoxylon fragiforme]|uniref:YjgF-like protein n=1 Tax=Hypoxylon fragiforme TaxID=63214 RepID=UPI0020C6C89C|nr:YjgF-like protein [Hypoxylon fragiforme]KAI2613667.1 YjgF-like protein [Hypoxylon fragiforme]